MTTLSLPVLRRECAVAQHAYTHAHETYWTLRHDAQVWNACEMAATRLDQALAAVLAALPPHDVGRAQVLQAQAQLQQDIAQVQERARLEALRTTT